ncbi:Uncharacterized protein M6B38_226325 [Iris pallida]|uniref:Uncharacterized protein n=1 Tax=Iris pallida TaxID=29817 RepID=A0AAX6DUD0_IRIPA|nr:Uncharacterized protein M6B38_226325 [Iris pallida]
MKKELLASAPWRTEETETDKFEDAKLKATNTPGSTPTMHVPRRKRTSSNDVDDKESAVEIDPELRYSFQRNYQFLQRVFTIDTLVKPLPPAVGFTVSRNLSFFTRIFTQFFGKQKKKPFGAQLQKCKCYFTLLGCFLAVIIFCNPYFLLIC